MSAHALAVSETEEISEILWLFLNDEIIEKSHPDLGEIQQLKSSDYDYQSRYRAQDVWKEFGEQVLDNWIRCKPGTRPSMWWEYDAPRCRPGAYPGKILDGMLPEQRERLGGTGTPTYAVLRHEPILHLGIPKFWIRKWQVDYYNGRARNCYGERIGTRFIEGGFKVVALDPDDLPVFESQASYLDRHGLLTASERAALPAIAYKPEEINF